MTLKVHSVVQDSYDFDRCFWGHPVHQEVASAPTVSRNVDRTKTGHDLFQSFGARTGGDIVVTKTTRFDAADYLDTEERQVAYIAAALESGDADFVRDALGLVARARHGE